MHPNVEVAIIGAGASGLVLASLIANRASVAILDANNSLTPKLKINERIIIIEDNDGTLKAYNKNGGAVF